MRFEYIEPFVNSTIKVLDSVISDTVEKGRLNLVSSEEIIGDVAIAVRVSGESHGGVVLNMPVETALAISNRMTGQSSTELNSLELDSIAELANMVAGNSTSVLNDLGYEFSVSTPEVIQRSHLPESMPRVEAFQIPLYTSCGEITINIVLTTT